MIIQGSERDTIALTNYQFQIPIPIPIPIPIQSPSTSLSLSSPQIPDQNEEESTSTFSSSYFHLLSSIGGAHTPVGGPNYFASKRALEQQLADGGDSDKSADPRKRRLMKNRESATRSRARKQALMNELQVEVTRLEEENLKLKQKCRELKFAIAAASVSSKKLRRTTSSEF
ncbi:uncharacterized protein LOC144557590 isoform X2 [Carex rostrata]